MTQQDIEIIYAALAEGIDRAAPEAPELFLARACLLMAYQLASPKDALGAIDAALQTG